MKYSKQREALLTLLRSTRSHPSADWLYENLRKEFPNISLGTVYRNLAQLAENGDILKISTSANKEHFDGFVHRRYGRDKKSSGGKIKCRYRRLFAYILRYLRKL